MSTKLGKEFDIQDYLIQSESSPQAFFKACVEEDPGDGSLVRIALIELAKTRGVGLSRQCLWKRSVPKDLQNSRRCIESVRL